MKKEFNPLLTSSYDYTLPNELIATSPANPKDSAKLLVYDRKKDKIIHAVFRDIVNYLPKDTSVVFNDTKVIKARIFGKKESGGKIELLLNSSLEKNFLVYIRGKVIQKDLVLTFKHIKCKVLELLDDGSRVVQFSDDNKVLDFNIDVTFDEFKVLLEDYNKNKGYPSLDK